MSKQLKQSERFDIQQVIQPQINQQRATIQKLSVPLPAQSQCYFIKKNKILKIKPVESDISDDQVYQQPHTYLQSYNISVELPEQEPRIDNEGQSILAFQQKQLEKNSKSINLNDYQYKQNQNLPKECLQILKEQKKQAYQLLLNILRKHLQGSLKKNIIFMQGNKYTGKKTLIFEAIKEIKQQFQYQICIFYLNFQIIRRKSRVQLSQLRIYLQERQIEIQKKDNPKKKLIIINNLQIFLYHLKKNKMFHQFKTLIKKSNCLLIIIDKNNIDSKSNQLWIRQNCSPIHLVENNKLFIIASFTSFINQYRWPHTKWTIHRPLVNYFCNKLEEQNALSLQIIPKFTSFLLSQPISKFSIEQNPENICKVTRQLLSNFSSISFDQKKEIEISKLNFHENCVIVSIYLFLMEHEQLVIRLSQLYKVYSWCCESLSINPKTAKELEKDVLDQLQTYRLISLSKSSSKKSDLQILIKMDLQTIREQLATNILFRKFFKQS